MTPARLSPSVNALVVDVLRVLMGAHKFSRDEQRELIDWLCALSAGFASDLWDGDDDRPLGWS